MNSLERHLSFFAGQDSKYPFWGKNSESVVTDKDVIDVYDWLNKIGKWRTRFFHLGAGLGFIVNYCFYMLIGAPIPHSEILPISGSAFEYFNYYLDSTTFQRYVGSVPLILLLFYVVLLFGSHYLNREDFSLAIVAVTILFVYTLPSIFIFETNSNVQKGIEALNVKNLCNSTNSVMLASLENVCKCTSENVLSCDALMSNIQKHLFRYVYIYMGISFVLVLIHLAYATFSKPYSDVLKNYSQHLRKYLNPVPKSKQRSE